MRDPHRPEDAPGEPLAIEALLYAGGELESDEAGRFEARLGEDQAAREALCQAVQFLHTCSGFAAPQPNPTYRDQVRRRFYPRPGILPWLTRRRAYRGHPALWSGLGAAVVLLLFGLTRGLTTQPPAAGNPPVARQAGPAEPPPQPAGANPSAEKRPAPPAASTEEARLWAQLHNSKHLTRARDEEVRRKTRAATLPRPAKTEERKPRVPGHPAAKH
jgi:hypothetical protein